jgi:hypothetical protein
MARKEKQFHYLYKIINIKNGKYYIGMHSTHNLDDDYMGGGKRIRNSIRKHGKEAHTKEILEYFDDRESLRQREIAIVNEDLLKDPMCMNINKGGEGGWLLEWQKKGASVSNKKNWNTQGYREKMAVVSSENLKRLWEDPEKSAILREAGAKSFLNKEHTEETKKRIGTSNSIHQKGNGNSNFGKKWIYNENIKKSMSVEASDIENYITEGWKLGRKMKF